MEEAGKDPGYLSMYYLLQAAWTDEEKREWNTGIDIEKITERLAARLHAAPGKRRN